MYGLNQWVRVKDYEVSVLTVEDVRIPPYRVRFDTATYQPPQLVDNYNDDETDAAPREPITQRVIFIDVMYRNPTPDKTLDCRRNQWHLYDADGYSYEAEPDNRALYDNGDKPFLGGTRYLNPGLKLRGWLAFTIREGAVPERVQFVDGFLRGNTVDFLLTPPTR